VLAGCVVVLDLRRPRISVAGGVAGGEGLESPSSCRARPASSSCRALPAGGDGGAATLPDGDGDGAADRESEMKQRRTGEVTGYAPRRRGNDHTSWPKPGSTRTAESGVQPGQGLGGTVGQPKPGPTLLQAIKEFFYFNIFLN